MNRHKYKEAIMENKCWFVWKHGGCAFNGHHATLESAVKEASRLARLYPDNRFIILESVKCVYVQAPPVIVEDIKIE